MILQSILKVTVVVLFSSGAAIAAEDFYVAPSGNDAWSGKLPAPSAAGNDGPFATLQRAQQAVRQLRQSDPQRKSPVVVQLKGGTYFLHETLDLGADDAGSAETPLVFAAAPGETPVVSGGVRLSGFKVNDKGRWQLEIPEVKSGKWHFSQLFVGGQRRYRPRAPAAKYFLIAEEIKPPQQAKGYDRFKFAAGDIRNWKNTPSLEVLCFHNWFMSRLPVASIDAASSTLVLNAMTPNKEHWAGLHKGWRYLIENVAEALEAPGQFYLDKASGVLTYIPMPGEDPEKSVVIAPKIETLVRIKGGFKQKKFAEHIRFSGITFSHTQWNMPPAGYTFVQAEAVLGGAISLEGARHCVLENCRVSHAGAYAIDLGIACKHNTVENCELTDLGAGGVKIGEMGRRDNDDEVASHNTVRNCLIAYGGRLHPAGIGVWIGNAHNNAVEHNEIYDFYYTGISAGWSWGYGKSNAHHNSISFNHIHRIGQAVLTDMGGIYTLGISPGTVLRNNHIHDVESHSYGGWGIYFDEGSTGVLAENNVVYRTKSSGFHQHYGRDNRLVNNIFAYGQEAQLMRSRDENHKSFSAERNIIYYKDAPLLGSNWNGDTTRYFLDNNVYWNCGNGKIDFKGAAFEDWKKRGQDVHSVAADPLFADPENGNFTLKPDSPALKLGFKPIDISQSGRSSGPSKLENIARAYPHPFK